MQAYGQTTYLITTLKRVPRGTEGAISAEGTLAGAGAALAFAALAAAIGQVCNPSFMKERHISEGPSRAGWHMPGHACASDVLQEWLLCHLAMSACRVAVQL